MILTTAIVVANGIAGSHYEQEVTIPAATSYFRLLLQDDGDRAYNKAVRTVSDCWQKGRVTVYLTRLPILLI